MNLRGLILPAVVLVTAGCTSIGSSTKKTNPPATTKVAVAHKTSTAPTAVGSVPTPVETPKSVAALTTPKPLHPHGSAVDKGQAFLAARQFKQAEAEFRVAISRNKDLILAYGGLGTAAVGLGDYTTAYRAYRQATRIAPRSYFLLYKTAYAALLAKDYHGAVRYATDYLNHEPRDAEGYHLRFLAYGNLLLHHDQVVDARKEVSLRPHNADAYSDLGIALGNDSQYRPSINAFSHAIQINPANLTYYTNRAIVENLNGQQSAALLDLQTARSLAHDPGTRKSLDEAIRNLTKAMHKH